MQGKSTYECNAPSFYFVSTEELPVYGNFADGTKRLLSVITGEQLRSVPAGCVSIECAPLSRKCTYEVVPWESPTRRETPDNTPVAVGIPMKRPPTLQEEMKRFIREEISAAAESAEAGTFEDEDDFDVDEEPEPFSEYEMQDLQEDAPVEAYYVEDDSAAPATTEAEPEKPAEEAPAASAEPPPPNPES